LGFFALLSTDWAPAVERGIVDANVWLLYAALLLLGFTLVRSRLDATVLLSAVGVGIGIVALSVLVRMLLSSAPDLFISGRLNSPLGYVNGEGCAFAMGCWPCLALAERRRPVVAGLGAFGVVALACLALLSESRGAAVASFAAVVVMLA